MFACSSKFYGRWVKFLCSFCLQDEAFCTRGLIPFWKLRQESALIHECETPHFKLAQINEKQAGKDIISITSGMPENIWRVCKCFGDGYIPQGVWVLFFERVVKRFLSEHHRYWHFRSKSPHFLYKTNVFPVRPPHILCRLIFREKGIWPQFGA